MHETMQPIPVDIIRFDLEDADGSSSSSLREQYPVYSSQAEKIQKEDLMKPC